MRDSKVESADEPTEWKAELKAEDADEELLSDMLEGD
jgi:hypothetical protein